MDRADLVTNCISGTNESLGSLDWFASNVAGYVPLEEPFFTDPNQEVGGMPVRSADFFEWNLCLDELDYALAMRTELISRGFPDSIGMVIDTSRNGWGGPDRPASASASNDLNTYVNQSRIDRREHRCSWCNQESTENAGLGERPTASPETGIDAYAWIKPPGESDGISVDGAADPDDPNKTYDIMCGPAEQSVYNSSYGTGAIPDSPH